MKNLIKILPVLGLLLALASCKEDKLMVFEGENNIYFTERVWAPGTSFPYTTAFTYKDNYLTVYVPVSNKSVLENTYSLGFIPDDQVSDTTFIPVRALGKITSESRDFAWKVIDLNSDDPESDLTTAVEGTHFKVLDAYIPGDTRNGGIVIEMLRSNLEPGVEMVADFELVANEHFSLNMPETTNGVDSTIVSTIQMRLIFVDGLAQPTAWGDSSGPGRSYLGPFSQKKLRLLLDVLGMPLSLFYTDPATGEGPTENLATIQGFGNVLKRWLDDYKIVNGKPYTEADGTTAMVAGPFIP